MEIAHINEKVFYRFVEFTSRLIKYDLAHEHYKLIALNKKEANTSTEKKVKRLADAFLYLLNHTRQIVDIELILTSYFLLTKKRLNRIYTESVLKTIYLNIGEPIHIQAADIMLLVNSLSIQRKLEFSLLLANYLLIKNNDYPVIFHEVDKRYLMQLLKTHSQHDLADLLLMQAYQTQHGIGSESSYETNINLNDVIEILKTQQEYLKHELSVKHLFIYGGLAKGNTHKSSDVDLLIDVSGDLVNYQKYELIGRVQKFLETKLETKLDVLDFNYSLIHAEIKEMNNIIKIF